MTRHYSKCEFCGRLRAMVRLFRGDDASAIVEFAVSLPLLVVLVVGIYDFGGAFNLKQELNNAVREGARFGAAQPTNDLASPTPPSVDAVRFLVASYLKAAKIDDCGLSSMTQPGNGSGLIWTYNPAGCGGSLTLQIQKDLDVPETIATNVPVRVDVLCTQVSITYPYQWHFNSVIQLLVPGSNFALTSITTDATASNMN